MSIVDTYKKEFRIVGYDEDLVRCDRMKEFLNKKGFNYQAFSSRGLMLESLSGDLPHVFILYYQPLSMKFREMLAKIRKASAEVQVIILGAKDFWPGVYNLINSGLVNDYWTWPMAGDEELELRLAKLIEKDIYRFIAEQRTEVTAEIVKQLDQLTEATQMNPPASSQTEGMDIMGLLSQDHTTEAKIVEEFLGNLKENSPDSEFIYFKNYKAKDQLLVTKTSFSTENYFRGQAIPFAEERFHLDRDASLNQLRDSIGEQFSLEQFVMQPVEIAGEFFGIVMAVHFEGQTVLQKSTRYLAITLRNFYLEGTDRGVEIDNALETGVSRSQFPLVLSNEISRARRLKMPLSLIVAHIEYIGDQDNEFAKTFTKIQESLRSYDYICQLEPQKLAIVMPHCGYEDAAIKAETLRRHFVARGLKTQNTPLRLCFGVSEFPSLSIDSDSLQLDAEKACQQVLVSGKNKVCLFTAEENHQPEFSPRPMN